MEKSGVTSSWPDEGGVTIDNYSTRYRWDLTRSHSTKLSLLQTRTRSRLAWNQCESSTGREDRNCGKDWSREIIIRPCSLPYDRTSRRNDDYRWKVDDCNGIARIEEETHHYSTGTSRTYCQNQQLFFTGASSVLRYSPIQSRSLRWLFRRSIVECTETGASWGIRGWFHVIDFNLIMTMLFQSFTKTLTAGLEHKISEGGENIRWVWQLCSSHGQIPSVSVNDNSFVWRERRWGIPRSSCSTKSLLFYIWLDAIFLSIWALSSLLIIFFSQATAAVDLQTDNLIQATIRSHFKSVSIAYFHVFIIFFLSDTALCLLLRTDWIQFSIMIGELYFYYL